MASLEAGSRLDNITKSVNAFVRTHVSVGLGYTVYYMGQDRTGTLPRRWVEVDLLPGDGVGDLMTAPGNSISTWTQCILNINVFEHQETGTGAPNLYALIGMVENVRHKFLITTAIPVYDYGAVGTPWAGALMIWGRPDVNEIPVVPDSGIQQINISVPLRYHEVINLS